MRDQKDPYVTIKVKTSTKSELVKMQGLYQMQHGEKVSMDYMIRTLVDAQPKVNMKGEIKFSKEPSSASK